MGRHAFPAHTLYACYSSRDHVPLMTKRFVQHLATTLAA